ncbi:MAG: hypothetical protein LQ351_003972 [Letrouitia transgressa]|nr:MAG: hypothetical protein LQ351_003972 [Letrouitia transgressa]
MSTIPQEQVRQESNSTSPGLSSPPSPNSPRSRPPGSGPGPGPGIPEYFKNGDLEVVGGVGRGATASVAKNTSSAPKRPRKKKDAGDDNKATTASDGRKQPAKPRKPRMPKNNNVSSATTVAKKELKVDSSEPSTLIPTNGSRQISATDSQPPPPAKPQIGVPTFQNGISEAIPTSQSPSHYIAPTPPRPASGQNYDPIRSATLESRSLQQAPLNGRTSASTPPRPPSNASVSPSIASLLEPHSAAPAYSFPTKDIKDLNAPSSPPPKRPRLTPPESSFQVTPPLTDSVTATVLQKPDPAEKIIPVAEVKLEQSTKQPGAGTSTNNKVSGNSSSHHSPKPSGKKDNTVPLPSGNGLLSSAMLGGRGYDSKAPGKSAPTVILHVPLDGTMNKYVNFAQLAEEQYGFDALHPRLAAQRERLARVAAAGAAIENSSKGGSGRSADEMSVDLSEGEQDGDNSNVEMGGVSSNMIGKHSGGEGSEATLAKKPRKRTMKEDMYDKDDPFVDDTELAWEEQAAASKDGFFVYSGPLVAEGEKANVERYMPDALTLSQNDDFANGNLYRADGTVKRGRGRARGPRGGTSGGTSRGGANGGGTSTTKSGQPRKPRVTKAAKLQMEQEKVQRESMAPLAAKPTHYPG